MSSFAKHWAGFIALILAASVASAQATPPFKRTILVGGTGSAVANGTALLNALASTGASGTNNRWLIRLEPGIFNVGTSPLNMKNFVDIEGSGRDVTTITSQISANSTVQWAPGITAEVRDLTIQDQPARGQAGGVSINSANASLSRVNVIVRGTTTASGVTVSGVINPVITGVAVTASSTSGSVFGFFLQQSNPTLSNVSVAIASANSMDVGIYEGLGASATVEGAELKISGSQINIGIWVSKGTSLKLTRSNVSVTGGQAFGLENEGAGTVTVTDSSIAGTTLGGFGGFGIRQSSVPGPVTIERSTLQGSDFSIASFNASSFNVAMTRLVKPISNNTPLATFTCAGAYDESFTLLNSGCL